MLLNELFTISSFEVNGDTILASVMLNPDHRIFNGHFPGNPILPGICTVEIARILIEKATALEMMLSKAGNIKYLGFINPHLTPEVFFSITKKLLDNQLMSGSVNVTAGGNPVCTFKGEYSVITD